MTIRVVLVDDHPLYRYGARFAIEDAEDLVIVGEASTGEEALQVVREKQVDVVLMDIQLPDRSGLEVTRAITGDAGPRVIVVSVNEDDDSIVSALRAGAHGYLVKGVSRDELLWAIRTVAAGGAVFGPSIADRLSNYFSAVHELPSRAAFPTLTNRERQVLDLIARGWTEFSPSISWISAKASETSLIRWNRVWSSNCYHTSLARRSPCIPGTGSSFGWPAADAGRAPARPAPATAMAPIEIFSTCRRSR
ncbi:response regulator [Amycolatopsis magusensis]|uniref:response regulator n=1 Tax=Amycolatopsis magusensis TaxID=882444 RepID=UPI0037AABCBB